MINYNDLEEVKLMFDIRVILSSKQLPTDTSEAIGYLKGIQDVLNYLELQADPEGERY